MLERRPKRKAKSKLVAERYTTNLTRPVPRVFQKKFVLIDFMGPNAPHKFAVKESYVVARGVLPEICVSASESDVRRCLTDAVSYSVPSLSSLAPSDFEFLEACGKCLCVPAHKPEFVWTGRAVKELAGTGAIYFRLTVEREEEKLTSDSDQSFSESEIKFPKIEIQGKHTRAELLFMYNSCFNVHAENNNLVQQTRILKQKHLACGNLGCSIEFMLTMLCYSPLRFFNTKPLESVVVVKTSRFVWLFFHLV